MKALLICGSPRKNGNTEIMLRRCADKLTQSGIESEVLLLAGKDLKPCVACMGCKNGKAVCSIKTDDFQEIFDKMVNSDIIIAGTPVYFGSATAQIKALLDRAGYVSRGNGNLFSRKIGAPVVVARRAGQNFTYAQLAYWYIINDMIVPGSTYWNIGFGGAKGEVENDKEALSTLDRLCENIVWLASKLH
ncbi:MAG: flavodoxin family protein [Lentisphaerota bacterium]